MKLSHNSTLSALAARGRNQERTNSIRAGWFTLPLGAFLFTSIFALAAPSVEARCRSWDASGKWTFEQGSGQNIINVIVDLQQEGTVVTGTAVHQPGGGRVTNGTVDGTVEDDSFAVKIFWDNNSIGVYEGTIRPTGRVDGKGWEQSTRRIKVNWHSVGVMKCADTKAVEPSNPTPKPITNTAKPPAAPTPKPIGKTGTAKTQPSAAAPFIKANPILVVIPAAQTRARTTLTWDSGPDHPNAEVWMEDMRGEERLVAREANGTRSVTVELGKMYKVILKDEGEQLARAAILTKQ